MKHRGIYRLALLLVAMFIFAQCGKDRSRYDLIIITHFPDGKAVASNLTNKHTPKIGKEIQCPIVMQLPGNKRIACKRLDNNLYASADLSYLEYVDNANAFAVLRGQVLIENNGMGMRYTDRVQYALNRHSSVSIKSKPPGQHQFGVSIQKEGRALYRIKSCGMIPHGRACASHDWQASAKHQVLDLSTSVPIVHRFVQD